MGFKYSIIKLLKTVASHVLMLVSSVSYSVVIGGFPEHYLTLKPDKMEVEDYSHSGGVAFGAPFPYPCSQVTINI